MISSYLISSTTKSYTLANNLKGVALVLLQPFTFLLAEIRDTLPTGLFQVTAYLQFPIYALLLTVSRTEARFTVALRCIIWWHVGGTVLLSMRYLVFN